MVSSPLIAAMTEIFSKLGAETSGEVATYIPELAKADPDGFAFAVATVDGQVFSIGDAGTRFTIQSMSKPFAYAAALDRLGRETVMTRVGVEPTGDAFNAIILDEDHNRPFNPMVNAGAIAVAALFDGEERDARTRAMVDALSRFAGRTLEIDEAVFRSEAETGHRNRAIAYLMLNSGMLAAEPDLALDTYFRQCSLLVDTRDLAVMAATLAAGGRNPLTGEVAVWRAHIPDVLTVMLTCGMYDYAGQWAYEVGLPAKSGVSGGVLAVVPGQFGIAAWSPKLDAIGNSVRAVAAIRALSERFRLHGLAARPDDAGVLRRSLDGRAMRSRRWRSPEAVARLEMQAERLIVLELHGEISVAAAERVLRRVAEGLAAGEVVLDVQRVTGVEAGAERMFADFGRELALGGQCVTIAGPGNILFGDAEDAAAGFAMAAGIDSALERAENRLLGTSPTSRDDESRTLADARLLSGLTPEEFERLAGEVPPAPLEAPAGTRLAALGEPADTVVIIGTGRLKVLLPVEGGEAVPLNGLGPGETFGEMALMGAAQRSADVVAETDVTGWSLRVDDLRAYGARHPMAMNRILGALAVDLSDRLRRVNATISALRR
ncbi:Glutaminase 1 [Methylobrevis pamukkalensis]|uniref:Glutaminase n=2 Tax=Methylobrevis pamukkalensis TaxID=1439726 RepID=A0A1E3H1R3_9HYPH|nr:Glutaminase 1 [Methylobrevis pamukkalensis]